jgi:TetR/AcrR family transcriptional regulator, transcriptional repressor for nem operon
VYLGNRAAAPALAREQRQEGSEMKKSKAETAKTRRRIVEAASEVIRNKGIDATGVAEIMAAAGLTHGGFYRHFDSKEALVSEALALSRKDYLAGTLAAAKQGPEALLKHFQEYVSPDYRDDIGSGCPLAANGSEIVRGDATTRHSATEALRLWFGKAEPFMRAPEGEDKSEMAINLVTNMIGALTVSRIVDDPVLSEKILEAARRRIADSIDLSVSKPPGE